MFHLKQQQQQLTKKILLGLSVGMLSIVPTITVQAMPSQGAYDNSAAATIAQADKVMNITGKSTNNVINWQSFSIAKDETVNFDSHNYLNLVRGADRSNIYGKLNGQGNIYLINPNGVLFGADAQVNVGALTVSTRPIANVDQKAFLAGNSPLTATATVGADIINKGNLAATNITLEGDDIVLTGTAGLKADAKNVTLTAKSNIDVGYDAQDKAAVLGSKAGYSITNNQTINDCELVSTPDQLKAMKSSGKYMLAKNIKVDDTFAPIEVQTLLFDGAGNKISGFKLNASSQYQGLFPKLNQTEIRHVNVDGQVTTTSKNTGIFVGQATDSHLDDVHVSGSITATYKDGNSGGQIGGIIGYMDGGSLTDSSSSATVSSVGSKIGGLVGQTDRKNAKSDPYLANDINTGTVSGVFQEGLKNSATVVGGVVGQMQSQKGDVSATGLLNKGTITGYQVVGGTVGEVYKGTLTNAANTGTVTSTDKTAGGVVGDDKAGTSISNIFNTGDVSSKTSKNNISGLVGYANAGTVTNGYTTKGKLNSSQYDKSSFGQNDALTKASTFKGWDTNVWEIKDGQAPRLKAFLHTQDLTGTTVHKTYDAQDLSVTGADLGLGDTVTSTAKGYNAGTYTGTVTDTAADGMSFTGETTLVIDKAPLTINVSNAKMTYGSDKVTYEDADGSPFEVDASSLKGSDTLKSIQDSTHKLNFTLTNGALADKSTGKVTKDVGKYKITAVDTGSTLQNYTVAAGTDSKYGNVEVQKASLTATLNDTSTTYGKAFDTSKALTVKGLVNGDTVSDVNPKITIAGQPSQAEVKAGKVTANVGSYDMTVSGSSKNYNINWTKDKANAVVNKADLNLDNLKVADTTTVYGTKFDTSKYTAVSKDGKSAGLVNGDTLKSIGLKFTNEGDGTDGRATQNVGTYTITANIDAAALSNYNMTGKAKVITGTAAVTPAALTLTATPVTVEAGWATRDGYTLDATKEGRNSVTPYAGTVAGYVNNDTGSILDGHAVTFKANASSLSEAGQYALTGYIDGSDNLFTNYTLTQAASNGTALTLTPATTLSRTELPVYGNTVAAMTSNFGSAVSTSADGSIQPLVVNHTSDVTSSAPTAENKETGKKQEAKTSSATNTSAPAHDGSSPVLTVTD